jgi:hypothetical protein
MLYYISINHSIIIYQNNYGTTIEKLNDTKGVFRSHILAGHTIQWPIGKVQERKNNVLQNTPLKTKDQAH